jgi:hypothetical protein
MPMTGNTVTLTDGREVDSGSEEWRDECFSAWKAQRAAVNAFKANMPSHLTNMRRMDTATRRTYLEGIRQKHGDECADLLKAAYMLDWEMRKAKQASAAGKA